MIRAYWWLCNKIGYQVSLKHDWDDDTFTLKNKNAYISLYKYIGKRDSAGWRKIEEIYTIKIR
jgi:hypothetical protein